MRTKLIEACAAAGSDPFGEAARFELVEWHGRDDRPGDFFTITRPGDFIAGVIRDSETARYSFGYQLELLVLKTAELGLGSCWLGYFEARFTRDLQPGAGEIMPAIAVVGPAGGKSVKDRAIRIAIGASQRKPWAELFGRDRFSAPLTREVAGRYAEPLELVRLAPSAGNTQPWRVVAQPDLGAFHFFLKPVKPAYEQKRLHDLDLGIALCHFELGARALGLSGKWERQDPQLADAPRATRYVASWRG